MTVALAYDAHEAYRAGAIVVGAERVSTWRPVDARLRQIVETVDVVARATGRALVDVGLVADVLRSIDPDWAWLSHLAWLMSRWDEVASVVAERGPVLALAGLVGIARDELDRRLDDLSRCTSAAETARKRAEIAHATLTQTCTLFEREAEALVLDEDYAW